MNMTTKSILERGHLNGLFYNAKQDVKYFKYARKSFSNEVEFLEKLKNDLVGSAKEYQKYRKEYDNYQTSNILKADKFFYWIGEL